MQEKNAALRTYRCTSECLPTELLQEEIIFFDDDNIFWQLQFTRTEK